MEKNTVIYKLEINKEIYIGSTNNYKRRLIQHKFCCNKKNNNKYYLPVYKFIRENGGWEIVKKSILYANKERLSLEGQKKLEQTFIQVIKPSLNTHSSFQKFKIKADYDKNYHQNKKKYKCLCCNTFKNKPSLLIHKETNKYKVFFRKIKTYFKRWKNHQIQLHK